MNPFSLELLNVKNIFFRNLIDGPTAVDADSATFSPFNEFSFNSK
jgi:hypothetical protein